MLAQQRRDAHVALPRRNLPKHLLRHRPDVYVCAVLLNLLQEPLQLLRAQSALRRGRRFLRAAAALARGRRRRRRAQEWVLENLRDGDASVRMSLQARADERREVRVGHRRHRNLVLRIGDGVQLRNHPRDPRERRLAVDHLVEDAPQRPDVGGSADFERPAQRARLPVEDRLRGHVVHGSHLVVAHDVRGVRLAGVLLRDSKVDQLECALDEQEVRGFEIRVDDLELVDGADGFHHLLKVEPKEVIVDHPGVALAVRAPLTLGPRLLLALGQQTREVDLAVLEDDVDETLRLANLGVDELDDVILPAQRLEQSNLIHEPRDGLLLAALQTDALERVRLALGAEHLVHLARAALADALELQVLDAADDDHLGIFANPRSGFLLLLRGLSRGGGGVGRSRGERVPGDRRG